MDENGGFKYESVYFCCFFQRFIELRFPCLFFGGLTCLQVQGFIRFPQPKLGFGGDLVLNKLKCSELVRLAIP